VAGAAAMCGDGGVCGGLGTGTGSADGGVGGVCGCTGCCGCCGGGDGCRAMWLIAGVKEGVLEPEAAEMC
jgi:hypothetical protein